MSAYTRASLRRSIALSVVSGLLLAAGAVGGCNSGSNTKATKPAQTSSSTTGTTNASTVPGKPTVSTAQLREQAVNVLLDLARNGTPEEKANALEGLRFAEGRLAQVAPDALRDRSPGVRGVAASALAKSKVCSCTHDVQPLLQDPSPLVRASAILSLHKCGRKADPSLLAEMLQSPRANERAHAAWVLGEMGESSARMMLAEAARDSVKRAGPGSQRVLDLQIAEARVKLGDDDALTEIRTALMPARNEDLEAAALAAQMAGDLQDRGSTNSLIALVEFKDDQSKSMPGEIRLAAVGALAKLGQPKGDDIARQYATSQSASLRAQSAMVFGALRKTENLSVLEKMLTDSVGQVRAAAATGILQIAASRGFGANAD